MKKIINFIIDLISGFIAFILVLLLVVTLVQRINGSIPGFFGYHLMYVITGSMEPEIMAGDAILVKDFNGADAKEGDIVCYIAKSGEIEGSTVVHKVVEEPYEENGNIYVITKGTANSTPDDPILADDIYGIVIYHFILLGKLLMFFRTIWGLLLLIIPIIYFIIKEIVGIARLVNEKDAE